MGGNDAVVFRDRQVSNMFGTVWTIIAIIIIVTAFITGGTAQGYLAITGCLAFSAVFEWFGFWD